MQSDDPSILAAMDGQEVPSSQPPSKTQLDSREEPTVFFFVVFGLVYEALATSTADAGPDAQRTSIVSLQSLKCLVKRKYCGRVFNDPPLFEELLNLFYRMALTEPSGVQVHLVEAIASLAESIKSDNKTYVQVASHLSPTVYLSSYTQQRAYTDWWKRVVLPASTLLTHMRIHPTSSHLWSS